MSSYSTASVGKSSFSFHFSLIYQSTDQFARGKESFQPLGFTEERFIRSMVETKRLPESWSLSLSKVKKPVAISEAMKISKARESCYMRINKSEYRSLLLTDVVISIRFPWALSYYPVRLPHDPTVTFPQRWVVAHLFDAVTLCSRQRNSSQRAIIVRSLLSFFLSSTRWRLDDDNDDATGTTMPARR